MNDNSSGEFHLTIFDGTAAGHDYVVGEVEGCIVAVPKNGTDDCAAPLVPPEPASGLTASSTPGSSIDDLFWGPSPDDPDAYAIYRSTTSGGGYAQIGTATALFYEDGGLANGTYHYVVRAVLNGVESVDSIQANVNVDGVSAPVPALGGVTVTLSPKGKNWPGEAVVEVVDQANGQPLAGAVVTGYWTLPPTVRAVSKPRRSA